MALTSRLAPSRPLSRRWRPRALAGVLVVLAVLAGNAGAAEAHDVLVRSSPADGSTLAVVPTRVTLTFSAQVLSIGTIVIVNGPQGPVQTGKATVVGSTVTQRLGSASRAGRYTVVWRATSVDGHPVTGTFSYTATSSSPTPSPTPTPTHLAPATTSSIPASPAAATPGPAAPSSATGSTPTPWVVGGGVVLLLLAAVILSRRTRGSSERERDDRS